jgi:hypothetical protein
MVMRVSVVQVSLPFLCMCCHYLSGITRCTTCVERNKQQWSLCCDTHVIWNQSCGFVMESHYLVHDMADMNIMYASQKQITSMQNVLHKAESHLTDYSPNFTNDWTNLGPSLLHSVHTEALFQYPVNCKTCPHRGLRICWWGKFGQLMWVLYPFGEINLFFNTLYKFHEAPANIKMFLHGLKHFKWCINMRTNNIYS